MALAIAYHSFTYASIDFIIARCVYVTSTAKRGASFYSFSNLLSLEYERVHLRPDVIILHYTLYLSVIRLVQGATGSGIQRCFLCRGSI